MMDPESLEYTSNNQRQHQLMVREWKKFYDKHKQSPPSWREFQEAHGAFMPAQKRPANFLPNGRQLYERAQRTKVTTSAGSDGIRPAELKALPQQAWEHRAEVLHIIAETKQYPESYYHINMLGLRKKGKGTAPIDHRMLAIFPATYRVEMGAWYHNMTGWLQTWLHPDVFGAMPGTEAIDAAWDAQSYLEQAMLMGKAAAISSYDNKIISAHLTTTGRRSY